jgi:predicted RNase H-like HicB family nuclease
MFDFFRNRAQAEELEYQIVLEQEADGTFVATSPVLPGYVAYGQSEQSAARRIKRAIRRNMDEYVADHAAASDGYGELTARHRTSLHFQLPLTTTAKIVLASAALVAAAGLLTLEARRRRAD